MRRENDQTRAARPAAPGEVLRVVAALVAMIVTVVLPRLVHRPALAVPVARATVALAAAAWRQRVRADVDPEALRAAVLALRDALLAVVAAGEGELRGVASPVSPPVRATGAGGSGLGASRDPRAAMRARDGPPMLQPA